MGRREWEDVRVRRREGVKREEVDGDVEGRERFGDVDEEWVGFGERGVEGGRRVGLGEVFGVGVRVVLEEGEGKVLGRKGVDGLRLFVKKWEGVVGDLLGKKFVRDDGDWLD